MEKRRRGRPATKPPPAEPKRPRGRPRKTATERVVDRAMQMYNDLKGDDDPAMALLPPGFTDGTRLPSLRNRLGLNRFFRAKRLGMPDAKACALAGISKWTVADWKRAAITEIDRRDQGLPADRSKDDCIVFYVAYAAATYAPLAVALEVVADDIEVNRSVDTARWFIERAAPEDYSPSRRVEVAGQSQIEVTHSIIAALPPQRLELLSGGAVEAEILDDGEDDERDTTAGGE